MSNLIEQAFPTCCVVKRATLEEIFSSTKLYVIFVTARSGSTWLTEMAAFDGRLGTPQEWFNETWIYTDLELLGCRPPKLADASDINDYIFKTITRYRSPSGVAGLKLSFPQAQALFELLESPNSVKQGVTYFYLRRRNLIAQAISLYRSASSGFFHAYQTDRMAQARFTTLPYDAERIQYWMQDLLASECAFEAMFRSCEIKEHRFLYEDMVADPGRILDWIYTTTTGKAEFSGTEPTLGLVRKISDDKNQEWELRFRAEQGAIIADADGNRPPLLSDLYGGFRS